jgi:Carboxypeptidase regulatory-like domain
MRRLSLAVQVALLAVCTVWLSASAWAQYRTSIQGVVTDPSGAVIPGATLTLTNPATSEKQVRVSNADGIYSFNALAAARFRLEVEKSGFEKRAFENVQLIPEQPNTFNIQLTLGSATQTVNVDASSLPALETATASVSGTVSDNEIQHLPSFGRDVTKLASLAPGAFGDQAQGAGGGSNNLPGTQSGASASYGSTGIFATENGVQVIANGNQTQNNGVTIDGINTASAVWGGSTVITPSEDSVESVKIVSNSYDAESGRFAGAQVQITSKSGTNQFHGSLFETTHSPGLNAYQAFNGQGNSNERDNSHFNQFGGSVGGPIWKNKIFFFFNYETVREPNSSSTSNGWYDTTAFDSLAPAGSIAAKYLSFPGNNVLNVGVNSVRCTDVGLLEGVNCHSVAGGLNVGTPLNTALYPTGQVVLGQDPGWTSSQSPGTGGDGSGGPENLGTVADIANYITTDPTTSTAAQYNGRLDADVTAKDRIGFAIYWVPQSQTFYNGGRGYDIFHNNQINDAFSGIWNHTFSPTFLNEARANAAGWRWNQINSNPQTPVGFPSDTILTTGSISVQPFGPNVGSILDQWTYGYKDVATKIIGRHTVKFGGDVTRLFYLQDNVGGGIPSYTFFNIWDFLNDAPQGEQYTNFNPTTGAPTAQRQDDREILAGVFVQDDFKLRTNLTLNLGVRWSYFTPLSSKEGNMYVAHPGQGAAYLTSLTVRKGNSWNAQKDNFGPELGFAWSPTHFQNKLVIRGGYGLNYNQEQIAVSSSIVSNPGLVVQPSFVMSTPASPNPGILYALSSGPRNPYGFPTNPNAVSTFGSNGLPTTGQVGVEIFPGTLPTSFAHHYSVDTQYDLGRQFIMSLGYQGSISRNLYFHENPNAVPAALGYSLNPQIGGGDYWSLNGYGNYNAMLTELKHQFSQQFMADAQFAWSKSLDTASSPYSTTFPPYSEPLYPYSQRLNYGRSDYNVTDAFKLFGMWQPILFRGNNAWLDKIVGGWSLSGIWNWHSGFPWTPVVSVANGSLYCGTCGYTALLPAAYLGGAGTSTSNNAFKTGSNYPAAATSANAAGVYFSTPTYTAYSGTTYGNAIPQSPGVQRNSLNGPGYRDLDLTLTKSFGLPSNRVLHENAKLELRLDAYNVFNNLNFNPSAGSPGISNNIGSTNFGQDTGALAARVIDIGARFSF